MTSSFPLRPFVLVLEDRPVVVGVQLELGETPQTSQLYSQHSFTDALKML